MRTDELIVELARSARPIRPLPPPGRRALWWIAGAALLMCGAMLALGPREDFAPALSEPRFLGSFAALLATMVTGAAAAFVLAVPGAERSRMQRALPIVSASGWLLVWLVALSQTGGLKTPVAALIHSACVVQLVVGALATGVFLLAMIARAAPLQPGWTAAAASLASMATGAALAQVLCPLDDPAHQLVGHVAVGLTVAAVGVLVGQRAIDRR